MREPLPQSEADLDREEPRRRPRWRGKVTPGKRTLTMAVAELQLRAASDFVDELDDPLTTAAAGVSGGGGELPHLDRIQRAFGRHALTGIRAHVGGAAAAAAAALGAEAYAFGDAIAFRASPSLHVAAHEAAHVVQQRAGVTVPGGVGRVGDTWERHADAVADRVERGESAEALLDQVAGPATARTAAAPAPMMPPAARAVQRTSSNGVSVSDMRFAPAEIKADGVTTSQATARWSGRTAGGPKLDWTIVGDAFGSTIDAAGGLITPGNATVPKDKDKVELTIKATDVVEKGAHTTGRLIMWDPKFLQAKEDFPKFVAGNYAVANFQPRTGGGKFDATYAAAAKRLTATVKMSFAFVDDDPAAKVKWNAANKALYVARFIAKAQSVWSGQWEFENVRDPKSIWKKLGPVRVSVKAIEDKAAHFPVTVHKLATVTNAVDQANFTADFTADNVDTQQNPFPNTGAAELAALQAKTPTPIQFAAGSAAIPAADQPKLEFLGTYLHAVRKPTFRMTITGHAQLDGAAVTPAAKTKAAAAARTLSQQRAAAVKAVIASRGVGTHRLSVVAKGDAGAASAVAWDKAEIGSSLDPAYKNKYPVSAHEFGHMLGIRDEYPSAARPAGAATQHHGLVKDALGQEYADTFAKAQTDSEGLMNGGSDVRPHHYVTLWEALAAATAAAALPAPPFGEADWKFVGM